MTHNNQTFIFVGDVEVGQKLSERLVQAGHCAASALSEADVILTYHPNQTQLEEVYFGSEGVLSESKAGAIFVDLSPTTPTFAQELNAIALVNDHNSIDAPLVVRDVVAQDVFAHPENLMIVAGGSSEIYDQVYSLLSAIAKRVSFMGKSGAGQASKIALTLYNAAAIVSLIEANSFYSLSGKLFDTEDLLDEALSLNCVAPIHATFLDALRNESYEGSYTVEIMMGEIVAALNAADDKDMVFPQAEAGFHLLELLAVVGGSNLSPAGLSLVFGSEEKAQEYGLDWSRAEQIYEHHHDGECCGGHDDDECCGRHDDPDHECCGRHDHHHHDDDYDDYSNNIMGFSSN